MKISSIEQQAYKKNNHLNIAGKSVEELIAIAGGTPCYVYDSKKIRNVIQQLKHKLPTQIKLHYAIKANPFPALVTQMSAWVDGFDVASHQELLLALASGMPSNKISIAGPGKSNNDLMAALFSGVVINVESENELKRIYQISEKYQRQANIAFRINPDFSLKNSGMQMAGGAKPFGIDAEKMPNILATLKHDLVHFKGFHIFTGSQNLNHQALIETHNNTFALAQYLLQSTDIVASQVNIGGGFGIPYFANESALKLTPVIDNLARLIEQYHSELNHAEIHLELGRYLVGEAGTYLSRIIDKKESRGKTYLVADGGMHHHLANSGNFGQVIRKNYPVLLASCAESNLFETVDVVGPLCTPLDILANQVSLPSANIGDVFAV